MLIMLHWWQQWRGIWFYGLVIQRFWSGGKRGQRIWSISLFLFVGCLSIYELKLFKKIFQSPWKGEHIEIDHFLSRPSHTLCIFIGTLNKDMADMNIKCADEKAERRAHNGWTGSKRAPGCSYKAKKILLEELHPTVLWRLADAVAKLLLVFYEASRRMAEMLMAADGER